MPADCHSERNFFNWTEEVYVSLHWPELFHQRKSLQEVKLRLMYFDFIYSPFYDVFTVPISFNSEFPYWSGSLLNYNFVWISMTKEIYLHKKFFNTTFRNTVCPRRIRTLIVLWESGYTWDTLYKNRKPERKPDPGPSRNLYGWTSMSEQICLHWIFSNSQPNY